MSTDLAIASEATKETRQELLGTFRRIVWQDQSATEGPRYIIATIDVDDGSGDQKTSVKGTCDPDVLIPGIRYRFFGKWGASQTKNGRTYDAAFEFSQVVRQEPHNRGGMIQYLQRYATGIGYGHAGKLWDAFGSEAARMLRTQPDEVAQRLPKIPMSTINAASEALQVHAATEDVRIELASLFEGRHFSRSLPDVLIKRWGIHAPRIVRHDPFKLMINRIPSCGFDRCDKLYMDLGLPPDRLKRQFAAIWRAMQEDSSGHTWFPLAKAEQAVREKISGCTAENLNWRKAVKLGVKAGWLRVHSVATHDGRTEHFISERDKATSEERLANAIVGLCSATSGVEWPDPERLEKSTAHQKEIAAKCFAGRVAILAGTPGTGKTTLAAMIAKAVAAEIGQHFIGVVAPTGKAAVRIQAAMERNGLKVDCGTVHRMLGVQRNGHDGEGWGFHYNKSNHLPFDFLMIDEASMLDTTLAADLFEAIRPGSLVLVVGDPYQLPPVGHGAPLRDLIAARLPHGELTEVLRNGGDAVEACRWIKDGRQPLPTPPGRIDIAAGRNWKHIGAGTAQQSIVKLKALLQSLRGLVMPDSREIDPIRDVQVICSLNEKGELNRKKLATILQDVLNPDGERIEGIPFRVGDKVMCTTNCKLPTIEDPDADIDPESQEPGDEEAGGEFVANGELGEVTAVSKEGMRVCFDSPDRHVFVKRAGPNAQMNNFELGNPITFHKSQGSQWPIVVLMIDKAADRMASRELWYTGVSRLESLVITIGELGGLYRQCKRVALKDRKTFLVERILKGLVTGQAVAP